MRKPRKTVIDGAYHICARANRQELILEDEQIKILFLDVLVRAKKKYGFIFRNFCLMGNHIHLEITPQNGISISRIMQWILSVFAKSYNKIFEYKGHVWHDRFRSKIIESLKQMVNTFIYIANNPVRAGLSTHPLDFTYTGLNFMQNGPPWPTYKDLLDPITDKALLTAIHEHLLNYDKEKQPSHDKSYSFRKTNK